MTPNEIVREIVTRLQLGGGVHEGQDGCGEWRVRCNDGGRVHNFNDLVHVAEAIRAVADGAGFSISRNPNTTKGGCSGHVWEYGGNQRDSFGATEAEALTRALHAYLRAEKIGEEHLQPPEPEEPWVDVSESVSTANLPEKEDHGRRCELEASDGTKGFGRWNAEYFGWNWGPKAIDDDVCRPAAVGEDISRWRYAK